MKEVGRAPGAVSDFLPCPLGGRDGFAFGEPLQPRCPWTANSVILRRVLVFAGCGQSMKYVVIGLSDPDAVGAGPRHALPGLRVPSKGF